MGHGAGHDSDQRVRKASPRFNPTEFDAQRWVKAVKEGGQKYLVITAKPHDGFALFDTALSRYDIVDATPYGKDPLKDLADACHQHGIKLFFYYSLLDWHHPDYYPRGKTGRHAGREDRGDWSRYVAYYQGQVRELCTQYGEIGGFLFDGGWDRPDADWDLEGTYKIVHDLQPGALVGNNHSGPPRPGEDFQIVDRDRPGGDKVGAMLSTTLPRVTCLTLSGSSGPGPGGDDSKNPAPIIHELLGAAGQGANLLLNVAARPEGTLGAEFTERLAEAGKWLDQNGATVYGTRRGPVPTQPWGVSVSKPGSGSELGAIYLHVIKPEIPVRLPRALLTFDAWLVGKTEHLERDRARQRDHHHRAGEGPHADRHDHRPEAQGIWTLDDGFSCERSSVATPFRSGQRCVSGSDSRRPGVDRMASVRS